MSSATEEEPQLIHNEVSDEHVQEALTADQGTVARLLSWTREGFTKKGDNYLSIVNSLKVKFILDQKECEKSYVIKILPYHPMKAFRDITNMAFLKEAKFYSELAPALSAQLEKVGKAPLRIPKCYHTDLQSKREVIIMEDLRLRGFKMYDRRKGMDVSHATLVLQELARLHSASLLLQAEYGYEVIDKVYEFATQDWVTLNEQSIKFASELFMGCIENGIAILNKIGGYGSSVKWLKDLKPQIHKRIEKQLSECPPFTVICHGDCWNNNTLFRYNEEGQPAEVMLLDLQLIRRASLATDLNYFTYASLMGPDRRDNIDMFLDTYYGTVKNVLEKGGLDMPFTRQQLKEEYMDKHLYGVISSLEIVPIVVSEDSAEIPDYASIEEGEMDSFVQKQQDNMLQMIEKNKNLRPRFLAIFDELVDYGIIS